MQVSDKDHEMWYGDSKEASKMVEEQLIRNLHCKLSFLNIRNSNIRGMPWNFKEIVKQVDPKPWPLVLKWVTMNPLDINMKRCELQRTDMEAFSYMIGKNPMGECKIRNISLSLCPIRKEGAKILAPALAINSSIQYLNLSSCRFGVSGVVQVANALK